MDRSLRSVMSVRGSQNKSRIRQQWLYGPEPPILRGTVGSTAFVIKNDIYIVSGWEHISKRYCLDSEKSYSVSTIQFLHISKILIIFTACARLIIIITREGIQTE